MIAKPGTPVETPEGEGIVRYGHYEDGKPFTAVEVEGAIHVFDDELLRVKEGEDESRERTSITD